MEQKKTVSAYDLVSIEQGPTIIQETALLEGSSTITLISMLQDKFQDTRLCNHIFDYLKVKLNIAEYMWLRNTWSLIGGEKQIEKFYKVSNSIISIVE
jgi:hypothetical protein